MIFEDYAVIILTVAFIQFLGLLIVFIRESDKKIDH